MVVVVSSTWDKIRLESLCHPVHSTANPLGRCVLSLSMIALSRQRGRFIGREIKVGGNSVPSAARSRHL